MSGGAGKKPAWLGAQKERRKEREEKERSEEQMNTRDTAREAATKAVKVLAITVAALLAALAVAGCGGSGVSKGPRQEIVIAQGTDPQTLDPHLTTVQQALNISGAICEPLAYLNYKTGEIEPLLAESWKAITDTTWQVKLREGVKFTNGEELTADAVKFSLERIANPEFKSPATIYTRPIKSVDVVDRYTVNITTKDPLGVMPLYMTRVYIVPPKYIQEKGDENFSKAPVGTGPFKLVEWQKDEKVVLEANPDYWGGKPTLARVTFRAIPETSTRMAALKAGEADIVTQVSTDEAESLSKDENIKILPVPGLRVMFVQFNLTQDNALKDRRVRQALNYAVDKDAIVNDILRGYARKCEGQPLTKEYFGFNEEIKAYPYDPEKAKSLLAEAGYGPDNPLALTLYAPQGRYNQDKEVAQVIAGQLQAAGVKVDLQVLDWGLFLNRLVAKDFNPMAFWGAATEPDADLWLSGMVYSGAAYSMYSNPAVDELILKGSKTVDQAERAKIYGEVMRILHDDAPYIYLYQQVDIYGVNKRVEGWSPRPDEQIDLKGITVKG